MDKSGIKNFAIEARKVLRESAIKKAGFYGITVDHISEPVQKLPDSEVFKTIAGDEIRLFADDLKKRNNLVSAIESLGFEQVIEETAYTWFNRLIAIRFMEVNDYLPSRVRVLSSEAGGSTPDIVRDAMEVDLNLSQEELDKIQKAKDENRYDDAFQMLFVKQCNELNAILPGLFEKTDDYMELLLDISYTGDGVVRMLTSMIPEDDFNVAKACRENVRGTVSSQESQGQIEIIGWMYQYYNTELKDDTFAKLKKNIKITKERIPAATQLFTPDWIVRYMVENSLGRVWIDHLRAVDPTVDEKEKAEEYGWKYYLPEAEQEEEVAAELVKVRAEYKELTPQDIMCIDPCSGSGHILVYMFDVLLAIYESEGISERDAAFDILEKNIFGLDIDKRAYQLSYFALMMKGRGVAGRRFFRGVETEDGDRRPIRLNVYAIDESNTVDGSVLDAYGASMSSDEREKAREQVETLLTEMHDAKEYGSIINVTDFDMDLMKRYLLDRDEEGQLNLLHMDAGRGAEKIWKLAQIGKVLAQKYDVVVTNPPYMGNGGMDVKLTNYLKKIYPKSKSDLFAVFIERCVAFTKSGAWLAMITQHAWMFLSSYEKIRENLLQNSLINMAHLGARAFDEIGGEVVQTTSFIIRKRKIENYRSTFERLVDEKTQSTKEDAFLKKKNEWTFRQDDFIHIPGSIYGYWISNTALEIFEKSKENMSQYANAEGKNVTTDNGRFIRCFWETSLCKTGMLGQKWVLCAMGGTYRKWFGNVVNVIDWSEKTRIFYKNAPAGRIIREEFWKLSGVTWGKIGTGNSNFRLLPSDYMYQETAILQNEFRDTMFSLALLNSVTTTYFLKILSPTMNFQQQDINFIPLPNVVNEKREKIQKIVSILVDISKEDWDSLEISWDFKVHPLVKAKWLKNEKPIDAFMDIIQANEGLQDSNSEVESCYKIWDGQCLSRFKKLKKHEEELNRIFIDIYGLQDELIPKVEDKDITVHKADIHRDIKSFVSYAVGCMFGRYSLDEEGLIYAGGEFDKSKYQTFHADDDAIIPITDEEYFDDDIVKRFVEFVSVVYGEDTLEENLDFIADALGGKGTTSREIIRNYFLNEFFKDHAKTYSVTGSGKRPIYWLFDSGKQNGFKCLIYMHRYTPDTVGLIRSVYLKKASDAIQKALDNAEYIIANTESNVDRALSTKKRDKYVKQLAEIKPYYQALSHVAMQRIELDLDDGVKVNYAKFQGIEVGGDGEKKQTINLLAKI